MIAVTNTYKDNVYNTTRQIYSKVVFEIIDVDAKEDAIASVTGENGFSKKDQIFNYTRAMSAKYATFENDYWKLDGTCALPPKPAETGYEIGWWSSEISKSDKTFDIDQVLTIQFTADHSSIGITITFDTIANECAEAFNISAYDSSDVLIDEINVTGNTDLVYIWDNNISDYRKIVITVTKTSNAYRRVRIVEMDFGIIQTYTNSEIIKIDVIEELDTTSSTVTSNEIKLTLDNQNKEFNILNPAGIYPYLQRKQKIYAYFGLVVNDEYTEYVQMGIFYLTEWKSDEGTLTATFTARDILDVLSQSTYRKGIVQSDNLYDIAVDVLTDAGISNYTIDTTLQSITSLGHIPILSHRDALQLICVAAKSVLYADRNGYIQIKQLSSTTVIDTIDFDNVYNSPAITLDKLVNTIDVKVSNYVERVATEVIYDGSLTINGTVDVWIEYNQSPCANVVANVSGGTLNSAQYYSNASLLNITASGIVSISAEGNVIDVSNSIYQIIDPSTPTGEQTLKLQIDNTLITSNAIADDVGNWIMDEYAKRFLYEVNWRTNPALETSDIVTVEDDFSEDKTMRITKQEYTYAGYISGKTYGRGDGT